MAPRKPTVPPTVAARVKLAREWRRAGVSLLALDAGLSSATVHFIEHHPDSDTKVGTLLAIARCLDVHPAWLAYGTGPMEPFPPELGAATPTKRGA